jgi:hypothetical protein
VQGQQSVSAAQVKVLAQTALLGCKDMQSPRCAALLKVASAFCAQSPKNLPLCKWRRSGWRCLARCGASRPQAAATPLP